MLKKISIFEIDNDHKDFPNKLKCDLCHDRINLLCIDRNAALRGQTVFRCQACRARIKKAIQDSLSKAHVAPTIAMQHPLQLLAFKHVSTQHTNDLGAHWSHDEASESYPPGTASKFGSDSELTLPPGLQWPSKPLAYSTYDSTVLRSSAMPNQKPKNFSDQTDRDAMTFERQTGYCTTPNSIDHPHGPHQLIPGESLARCNHCVRFLPTPPNCKHYDSDGSSTDCPESDASENIRSPNATVKNKETKRAHYQKYVMDLIQRCRESAEASAPEDAQFKEHNRRIEALNKKLHATLDKTKRCVGAVPCLDAMD